MREILFEVRPTPDNRWVAQSTTDSIESAADTIDELRVKLRDAVKWRFVHDPSNIVIKINVASDNLMIV